MKINNKVLARIMWFDLNHENAPKSGHLPELLPPFMQTSLEEIQTVLNQKIIF